MHVKQDNTFLGNYGERAARKYLQSVGMRIIETNYTLRSQPQSQKRQGTLNNRSDNRGPIRGEIDIVAREGQLLVFVEVKWRSNDRFGRPVEGVTPAKQRRLRLLGEAYIAIEKPHFSQVRFDIVGLTGFHPYLQIEHIRNAF